MNFKTTYRHPGSESTHAYCMFRLHQIDRVLPIASQAFSNWTWGFSPPWNARKLPTLDSQQMSATYTAATLLAKSKTEHSRMLVCSMRFTTTYIQDLSQHMDTACANSPLICPYAGLTSRSRTQASSSDRACVAKRITIIQQLDMGVLSSLERPQTSNFGLTTSEHDINSSNAVGQEPNRAFTYACLKYALHDNIHPGSESTHEYRMRQ